MREPIVYLNSRFVPASQASLAIWDAGIVQGATIAEMTRTFRKQPFRLKDHLDRLYEGLSESFLELEMSPEQLMNVSLELLTHNAQFVNEREELGLIHFVTAGEYGVYAMGRPPRAGATVCVHTFPLPFAQWTKRIQHGVHLVTTTIRQVPPQCWSPTMKCRSRMHYYLAEREARRLDPEASALLLDLEGRITETNTGNYFMVRNGVLSAPPTAYTLPGISRATVLELADALSLPFVERDIPLTDALAAEEAFLSSSSYCLMPVTRLNGVPLGEGRPGPTYRRLVTAWSERVGVAIERQILEAGEPNGASG